MRTTAIRCHCGQRIVSRDVMQRSWYVRVFGPSFMYLKYRCSRCKRMGEKFIEQDKWDDSILRDIPAEVSLDEKRRFDKMGKISVEEQIEFHFSLEGDAALSSLPPEKHPEKEKPEREKPEREKPEREKPERKDRKG